ncbi:MAG: glycosyltransferase [Blastococcus sp.]|nr:glycosyltransferase [Blastococcus sp.]
MPTDAPLVVLQSFPRPRRTTNPYLVMLRDGLEALPGVEVLTFSWRRALRGGYDVFHVHWPEILVNGHSPLKKLVRQVLFVLLVLRLRLTRTPLVRTVHNLHLPEGISRRETWLLRWAERRTSLRIRINEATEVGDGAPVATIVHGHYRDWYGVHPRSERQPGRLTFFGLVRRYKGVDLLVDAFEGTRDTEGLTLRIAGNPSSDELAGVLRAAAEQDGRISLALEYLSDPDLVTEVSAAELVVLPYREMHNSGGALTALSLDTPVLVPDNEANRGLSDEVGPGWVHRYSGALTAEHLTGALEALRAAPPAAAPDLGRRDWSRVGEAHVAAYREALAAVRG